MDRGSLVQFTGSSFQFQFLHGTICGDWTGTSKTVQLCMRPDPNRTSSAQTRTGLVKRLSPGQNKGLWMFLWVVYSRSRRWSRSKRIRSAHGNGVCVLPIHQRTMGPQPELARHGKFPIVLCIFCQFCVTKLSIASRPTIWRLLMQKQNRNPSGNLWDTTNFVTSCLLDF